MSLQDIYNDLNNALHDGVIILSAATVPDLGLTLEAIGIVGNETLTLTGATLTLGPVSVVLTGNARYRNFTWSTTLTGESIVRGNRFTLAMQGQDAATRWTFGTSFPNLPQSRTITERLTVPLVDSVLLPLVVEQPLISVTTEPPKPAGGFKPSFQGTLVLTGSSLEQYILYFGSPRLRLAGTINFVDPAKPVFVLWAAAPGAQIGIPVINISEAGIRLRSDAEDIFSLQEVAINSVAEVYAKINFGVAHPITAEVTTPLLQGNFVWPLTAVFSETITASTGFGLILEFFGQPPANLYLFPFPLVDSLLRNFGVKAVGVGIQPPLDGQELALKHASIALTSSETWRPSLAFITVRELGTAWTFHWNDENNWVTGNVWGKLTFFDDPALEVEPLDEICNSNKIELIVNATLPNWIIEARNESDICVPLGAVLKKYLGGSGGIPDNLRITEIFLQAIPPEQTYQASMMVEGLWSTDVNRVRFSLDKVIGELYVTQSKVYGSMTAMIGLAVLVDNVETTKATFNISAEYRTSGVWRFEGGLADGVLSLIDFAWALLGLEPVIGLPEVLLTDLWFTYENSDSAATDNPYSARGTLEIRWQPQVLGLTLSAAASAFVERRAKKSPADEILVLNSPRRRDPSNAEVVYVGELSGIFTINRLTVRIAVSFTEDEEVYIFEVTFGKVTVRAATELVKNSKPPEGKHQILVITLRGFTLGDVVTYLINLANPNANYQLDAPWSFLNSIDLSRFETRIDPTEQTIALTYRVNLSLAFATLDTVGLLYDRSSGEGKVKFVITGSLLGKRYDLANGNPLTWDAIDDPPPEVPGEGVSLIDLRYLGAGQHVTLTGLTKFNSITEVLAKLREEMQPITDPKKNPLEQSDLHFDPSSQWMFGIDITVMGTVSVGIVLHDPDLYGLVLSLAGPDAGSLAGLSFELLYKKVTDDVGVFRVRLQVPDAFRQINLGYISITLGIITVDIFTNGNFMVDLGFPHNRDFTNSFGLEAGIFIGRGGIYFGLLNGATSTRVPKITNGNFSPVIELGVGLAVGVGRTFEKGPLKAGLYVQVMAIFEGVLAWFHPTDQSQPNAMYYWAQGSAGLIGKLYGSVDFKVIKVSVSIEAHAIITFTFASHRATLVELDVGVKVNASVKILFVRVSFSFKMTIQASFTIGSDSATPWILADGQSSRSTRRLTGNVAVPRRRNSFSVTALTREVHLRERFGHDGARLRLSGGDTTYDLHWPTDVNVFPDGQIHPVAIRMLPSYTIDLVAVKWPNQPLPTNDNPAYRINFMLMADSGSDPNARTIDEESRLTTEHLASADTVSDIAFNVMIEAMFRWSLAALGLNPVTGIVSLGQLQELARQLDLPETETSLSMTTLGDFFKLNLEMRVSGNPAVKPPDSTGIAFPVPPPLGWDSATTPADNRRFASYQPIDSTYEHDVQQYFAKLDPQPGASQLADTHLPKEGDETESMATFIFRDYFLLIAKASVQAALSAMAAFPYTVTGSNSESLSSIAGLFPTVTAPYVVRQGDTVDQVADAFGMSSTEIISLNPNLETELRNATPGQTINVVIGATPESIATGNPTWPLKANVAIDLGDVLHQVLDNEMLSSIATKFGSNVDTWLQDPKLLAQLNLLLPGAGLNVPQSSFVNTHSLTLGLVAAFFFVREHGTDDLGLAENGDVPLVEWYVQAIGMKNSIDFAGPLPVTVRVPPEFDNLNDADLITWFTQPGDTIWTIAATFAVFENQTGNDAFASWLQAVIAVNPGSNAGSVLARVLIPQIGTSVFPGEVLDSIANRFPVELPSQTQGQWLTRAESFRAIVKSANILAPLTPVTVPQCHVTTTTDQTISSFAAFYDLAVEDLGARVATVTALLAPWPDHSLTVPHPASAPIGSGTSTPADLVPVLLRDYGASIAGQTSRYLVAGLRMRAPVLIDGKYRAEGAMTGLYELTGQQLTGPVPVAICDPLPPPTERMHITVKNYDSTATWLKLYDPFTVTAAETLTEEHLRLNPGLVREDKRTRGLVALSGPIDEIVFSITDVDLCVNYPALVLQQVFNTPPAQQPLFREVDVRYALQQQIRWQTTETIVFPDPHNVTEPSTGMPTLWPFSSDLMRAEMLNPTKPFALCNVDPQLGPSAEPQELTLYAWATTIDIRIRTIPGLPNTYEVFGADTAGRQLLLEVWEYLKQTDTATIHILYQQSVSAGLPNGLTSVPVTGSGTYIIKTNLTTETQSGFQGNRALGDPPTFGEYYALLSDSLRFLTLMWECSVVGGGGYWLQYTAASGAGLPQSIFSSDGTGSLTLLVLLASQMNTTTPDRKLHLFNNAALVGNSIDASASNLFARVANQSDKTREATVDPGNVAFFTSLDNPPPQTDPINKQIAIRQLYGMLAYELVQTTAFGSSNPSMPVGPQVPESSDEEKWELFQVVPIWRYARAYPLPTVAGLPAPGLDPYAGITGASSGNTWTLANTTVSLSFRDVYGNNSPTTGDAAAGGPDVFNVDVGYTDPVIGIGSWPATTAHFTVMPIPEATIGATLVTNFALQASTHLPAGMQRTSDSAKTAANQHSDFVKIYYQLSQRDVSYSLSTTLDTVGGNPHALVTTGSLLGFAAGACAWLESTTKLTNVYVDTVLAPKLATVSETYGVGYEGLGMANGDVPLSRIFTAPPVSPTPGTDFTIPVYAVFSDGASTASITPSGIDPVSVLENGENTSLLIHAGTELVIPPHNYTVPNDPPPPALPLSLAQIAEANTITIASLVSANQNTPALLREGFVFTCEGVEVFVSSEDPDVTLNDVALTFKDKGVNYDAVMVAGANQLKPGMFRAGAVLVIDHYIIKEHETLSANGSGATVAELAQRNTTTVDLFYSGTAIYVKFLAAGSAFNETVNEASTMYALTPDQLLRFNRNVALAPVPQSPADELYLAIPGHAALPSSSSSLHLPYRITPDATLDGIAALFLGLTALSLAQANVNLPGVLAGGKEITVAGQTVNTTDGESFSELLSAFNPAVTLEQVVAVIEATPGYLQADALLLTTPAQLAASPAAQTPQQVATRYGITVNDFAVANSGLTGIVVAGVQLVSPQGGEQPPEITTHATDTFVSFVWRFAQLGIQTTVADVIAANSDRAFIAGGASILLAPAPAKLTAPFGANGWQFPHAIFDVHTFLEIKRQNTLVNPDFRGGAAEHNVSSIPAVPRNNGTGADAYLAIQQFARDVKAAIPVLRIATGKVLSEDREPTSTDVWGIAFGSNYIDSVKVEPGVTVGQAKIPQYFALRPLDNSLVARNGVEIKPLLPDGTLGPQQLTDFQGVDMETWAQRFLADVDLFVSAPYAAAAYQTPKRQTLESVLGSKNSLAAGIAKGLDYVLELGQPDPSRQNQPPDWKSAVESLRQRLLVSLTVGYNVDAVVQYNATVTSPWTDAYANFSGPGKLPNDPQLSLLRTTLSSAKTPLTTTPQGKPDYVNFLLGVAEEGRGSSVVLDLRYPINEVEFNIEEIVDGYDASDWVTLVLNDDLPSQVSINLGSPDVPLPVRSYPPLPTLLGQAAVPTHPEPSGYAEAMLWDYTFAYQHQSRPVDQIWLEVEFNQTPLLSANRNLDDVDLFSALAQYDSVAPQLWDILKRLPDYAKAADKTTIENAMATFASLVGTVATAWGSYWTSEVSVAQRKASVAGPQPERYRFLQTLKFTFDPVLKKSFYSKLYLKREPAQATIGWPWMSVLVGDQFVSMGNGVDTPDGRQYDFPEHVEAFNLLTLEMRFAGLAIANYQNASSQLQVVRNAHLLPLAPTRSAFVYQTQWFAFPNLVSPLLTWRDPFPIGAWTTDPATNPLTPVFNQLFGGANNNRTISCGIRYGYELATSPGADRIVPYLPVAFRPKFLYDPTTATGTVQQIITAISTWYSQVLPVTTGGEWLIGLSLYSSVDGQLDRPLLELPVFATAG